MTVKEAMTKVSEDRETFPMGWNTEMKEVYAKSGKALYERKQKTVYLLQIRTPYNDEADTVTVYRDRAKALAAMEDDIRDTLNGESPHFDRADLVNDGAGEAHIGDEIFWYVQPVELIA